MQGLDLEDGSKMLKDNQKTLALIIQQMDQTKAREAAEFRKIAFSFLPASVRRPSSKSSPSTSSRHASEGCLPPSQPATIPAAMKQQFKAMTSKISRSLLDSSRFSNTSDQRRMTHAGIGMYEQPANAMSQPAFSKTNSARLSHSEPARSPHDPNNLAKSILPATPAAPSLAVYQSLQPQAQSNPNLDYLSFSSGTSTPGFEIQRRIKQTHHSDWQRLLADIDNGNTNIFDNIYGGPPVEALKDESEPFRATQRHSTSQIVDNNSGWDPEIWAMSGAGLIQPDMQPAVTESVFSFSTDDGSGCTMLSMDDNDSTAGQDLYKGIMMPDLCQSDDGIWDSADQGYAIS